MNYSSITQKKCKCGCDKFPTLSFSGWNKACAPQEVLDRLDQKQKRKNAVKKVVSKLRNEAFAEGNFNDANLQNLKNDLDWVISRYVRMLYSDERGICQCYTCSTTKHYSFMQCGHYVPRGSMQTRFMLKNLRPQCPTCNEIKSGNLEVFTERLELEEKGITEYLKKLSREPFKWGRDELKQLLIDFRAKLRFIETKFKTP